MEPIYLDMIMNLISSNKITLEGFYIYIEGVFGTDKQVCIYENVLAKNPGICFRTNMDFRTWWDAMEAKKADLAKKIGSA